MKKQLTVYSALEKRLLLSLCRVWEIKVTVLRYTKKSITYSLYGKKAYFVVSLYRSQVGLNWKYLDKVNQRNYP